MRSWAAAAAAAAAASARASCPPGTHVSAMKASNHSLSKKRISNALPLGELAGSERRPGSPEALREKGMLETVNTWLRAGLEEAAAVRSCSAEGALQSERQVCNGASQRRARRAERWSGAGD